MNIDKALAQLADPEVSTKKKRALMDKLNEQTTQKQQNPAANALIGVTAGGLAAVLGGVAARKAMLKRFNDGTKPNWTSTPYVAMEGLAGGSTLPKNMRRAASELIDEMDVEDAMRGGGAALNGHAMGDAASAAGAGVAGMYLGQWVPGILGGLTSEEARATPPEFSEALSRVQQGAGSSEDQERIKKYHEGASNTGGMVPFLGSLAAGAALGIPTMYLGGPAAGRLMRKWKAPIAKTDAGRELAGEIGFDALAGTALGGAGASAAYNALQNPYEEPF